MRYWLKTWILRTLLFPLWMWGIWRSKRKTVKILVHGVEQKQSDVSFTALSFHTETIAKDDKIKITYKPSWLIELIDKTEVYQKQLGRMVDEKDGFVIYADFMIKDCLEGPLYSRVTKDGKHLGTRNLSLSYAQPHDIIKIRHVLIPTVVDESIIKPLRCLRLMTANTDRCRRGTFPVNHFALIDDQGYEDLGDTVQVKVVSWRPKAIDFTGKNLITSYDLDSPVFRDITYKNKAGYMYGPELTLELESGENVLLFCSTKSMRHALNRSPSTGQEWSLGVKHIETIRFSWYTIAFNDVEYEWCKIPLKKLGSKRLYNIIEAIKRGHWITSGRQVKIKARLQAALQSEWENRKVSKKKIKKIIRQNKKWEARNL